MNEEIITSQYATVAHSAIGFLIFTIIAFLIALYFDKKRYIKFAKWGLVLASIVSIATLLYGKYAGISVSVFNPENKQMVKLYSEHQVWSNITFVTLLLISAWGFLSLKSKYTLPLLFYLFCAIAIAQLGLNGKVGYELMAKMDNADPEELMVVKKIVDPAEKKTEKAADKAKVSIKQSEKDAVVKPVIADKKPVVDSKTQSAAEKKDSALKAKTAVVENKSDKNATPKPPAIVEKTAAETPVKPELKTSTNNKKDNKADKTAKTDNADASSKTAAIDNKRDKSKLVLHPGAKAATVGTGLVKDVAPAKTADSKAKSENKPATAAAKREPAKTTNTKTATIGDDPISLPDLTAIKNEAASVEPGTLKKPVAKSAKKPGKSKRNSGKTPVKTVLKPSKKPASKKPSMRRDEEPMLSLDDLKKQISQDPGFTNEVNKTLLRKKKLSKANTENASNVKAVKSKSTNNDKESQDKKPASGVNDSKKTSI